MKNIKKGCLDAKLKEGNNPANEKVLPFLGYQHWKF